MTELRHTDPSQWVAHTRGLRALARHLAGPLNADDHVQDTWVAALDNPPPSRSPQAWFRQVLRNTVRAGARRQRRWDELEKLVVPEDVAPRPDEQAEAEDASRVLGEVLNDLDEPYRFVLRERFYGDRSLTEIARQLGCPDGTVRWRVHEGLRRMRQELDRRFGARSRWYGAAVVLGGSPTGADVPASMGGTMFTSTKIKALSSTLAAFGLASLAYVACVARDEEPTTEPNVASDRTVEETEDASGARHAVTEEPPRAEAAPGAEPALVPPPRRAAAESAASKAEAVSAETIRRDTKECETVFIVAFNADPDDADSVEHLVDAAACFEEAGAIGKAIHVHNALTKRHPDSRYAEESREAKNRLFWAIIDPDTGLQTKVARDCVARMPDDSAQAHIEAAECMYSGAGLAGAALEYRKSARKRSGAFDATDNDAAIEKLQGVVAKHADRLEPSEPEDDG